MILNTNPYLRTHISINQNQNLANSYPILINLNKFKSILIKPKSTSTILGSSVLCLYQQNPLTTNSSNQQPVSHSSNLVISDLASCSRSNGFMIVFEKHMFVLYTKHKLTDLLHSQLITCIFKFQNIRIIECTLVW